MGSVLQVVLHRSEGLVAAVGVLAFCLTGCASTTTVGPIPPGQIDEVFARYESEITNCYVRVVRGRVERPIGEILVQFEVERDGRVRNGQVLKSELGLPIIDQCLLALLVKMKFPDIPRSMTVVKHTFKFTQDLSAEPE